MLHNINFCAWRNTQLRVKRRIWCLALLFSICGLIATQAVQWQAFVQELQITQRRVQQIQFSLDTVKNQHKTWQQKQNDYEQLHSQANDWMVWLENHQRPRLAMKLMGEHLVNGIYLDVMHLTEQQLTLEGVAREQAQATSFAANLLADTDVVLIEQLRIGEETQRWQQSFYSFQLQLVLKSNQARMDDE